jgi:cellulose synthase/poly-beta-1,6-N-acetylglucosamine synthase-like glycosyltransferase
MECIVVLNGLLLMYVYFGYLYLLKFFCLFSKTGTYPATLAEYSPSIDIIIAAHNEETVIGQRIDNVLSCGYPGHLLRVIVASDRSTDETNKIVTSNPDPRVILISCSTGAGKSDAQNVALKHAKADVILFTDADSVFSHDFLREVTRPFSNPAVGVVGGKMVFISDADTGVEQAQGYYWQYELKVRECESRLGILAKASGSCLAVRRSLIKPIPSDIGEDCIVPLDVVMQGYKVVHADKALAYDSMDSTVNSEFSSRVRMTLRNWTGTWRRAQLLNVFKHPGYAFSLWSHKILRWLSPFFVIAVSIGTVILAFDSKFWALAAFFMAAFYLAGILGWWCVRSGFQMPVVRTIFSFLLANAGFMVGIIKALAKKKIIAYR